MHALTSCSPKASPAGPTPGLGTGSEPSTGTLTYDESTPRIELKVGGTFAIALPDNVSVPRKWQIDPALDGSLLGLESATYTDQPPLGCEACVGHGGTRLFTFKGNAPGTHRLRFVYGPLRNPALAPEKIVSFTIVVDE